MQSLAAGGSWPLGGALWESRGSSRVYLDVSLSEKVYVREGREGGIKITVPALAKP